MTFTTMQIKCIYVAGVFRFSFFWQSFWGHLAVASRRALLNAITGPLNKYINKHSRCREYEQWWHRKICLRGLSTYALASHALIVWPRCEWGRRGSGWRCVRASHTVFGGVSGGFNSIIILRYWITLNIPWALTASFTGSRFPVLYINRLCSHTSRFNSIVLTHKCVGT